MPLDFPNNPTTNQTYTFGSTSWKYDGEKWVLLGPLEPKIQVTAAAPSAPSSGAMWVDSDNGSLYVYYDGFWVAPNINYSIGTSAISDGAVTYLKLAAQTIDTKSDSYSLVTADKGKLIAMNKATAQTVTVGKDVFVLNAGEKVDIIQTGAGQVTVASASAPNNVTINGTPGLKLRAQYSAATLVCTGTNTYVLIGDLAA